MPPAVKLQARPAARGLAYGPLMWMSPATGTRVASNDPALERAALQDAIGKASASKAKAQTLSSFSWPCWKMKA